MLIAFVGGVGLILVSVQDIPEFNEDNLIPAIVTQIFDCNEDLIAQIGVENRTQVSLSQVPLHVQNAFLAAEDHVFYEHHGIRIAAIIRAASNDVLRVFGQDRNLQGASTITQQLVKLAFLNQDRVFKRKIQEMVLSFQMESKYSKEEILAMYFNRIYFGEGAYGIQAAAKTYFGKDAEELTIAQGAMLAGIIRSPNSYSPFNNLELAIQHQDHVLSEMIRFGFISEEEYQEALSEELKLIDNRNANDYPYPYFLDDVTEQLVDMFGEEQVFKGGLQVYTTLDPVLQSYVEKAMADNSNFPSSDRDDNGILQPQGAMVVMNPENGQIKALVGGREHTSRRSLNRATMSERQPGSAIKPIVAYGPAIDKQGLGPATVINDAPVIYRNYNNYSPRNSDGTYRGYITLRTALTYSVNIVAVKLIMDYVKIENAVKFAKSLGLDIDPTGPAIALGGLTHGVTPLSLTAAYAAFDNHGVYNKPISILQVKDYNNNLLYEATPDPQRAMKDSTAYLMTDMMKSVISYGTGTNAQIGRPAAGKTGTTDEGKDIWFAGYTPDLVGVVWIGYDLPKRMPSSFGGMYPAGIWRTVMSDAHQDIPVRDFIRPAGVSAGLDSRPPVKSEGSTPPADKVDEIEKPTEEPTENNDDNVKVEEGAEPQTQPEAPEQGAENDQTTDPAKPETAEPPTEPPTDSTVVEPNLGEEPMETILFYEE